MLCIARYSKWRKWYGQRKINTDNEKMNTDTELMSANTSIIKDTGSDRENNMDANNNLNDISTSTMHPMKNVRFPG